jgi:hypothetical protein
VFQVQIRPNIVPTSSIFDGLMTNKTSDNVKKQASNLESTIAAAVLVE